MKRKGWIVFLSVALLFMASASAWPTMKTGIPGLTLSGYIRNQSDIRVYSPNDFLRCDTNAALRADYNPSPFLQFYLELRPFVDTAFDMRDRLSRHNRGIMGIENEDYAWRSSAPHVIGSAGTDTEVGGYVANRSVLSTNVNTPYWRQNSLLREAWFRYRHCNWDAKIGKQIVTWGETDGLKLLDIINPTDFRHFIIDDMEDSKIPVWMMNLTYNFTDKSNLQFIWIPWYVENFMAPAGSPWALNGVNLIYFYDHFDALNIVRGGAPLIAAQTACTIDYNDPANENEFGIRYKGAIGTSTDFTLNFFYTHQHNNVFIEPVGYNPLQPILPGNVRNDVFQFVTNPAMQRIYGFSFNHVFGNFLGIMRDLVTRGEVAFYHNTEFFGTYKPFGYFTPVLTTYPGGDIGPAGYGLYPAGDLFITKRNLLRLCSGWDKMVFWKGLNWLLSAQLFWEHIFDYPHRNDNYISNVGLTKAYQDELTWTFYANTDIMNERIKFDNLFVWNQMKHDGWNRFKVGFDISDHWAFWIGNNFFWGSDNSGEINPFVGTTPIRDGVPFSPLNPDADTIGRIRRGGALGEMKRNTSFFVELKYLF
ncbi:MAG: DUF1302 family protein [Pseudomonadota bacterium]